MWVFFKWQVQDKQVSPPCGLQHVSTNPTLSSSGTKKQHSACDGHIKGEVNAVRRKCTGWKEKVHIIGNVRMSASNDSNSRIASVPFLPPLVLPDEGNPIHGDILRQELPLSVLPELLYTQSLDAATWRVEPVYVLISRGGDWNSNMPFFFFFSQLLQNKLQRRMHARAHTHLFTRACALLQRVKRVLVLADTFRCPYGHSKILLQTRWTNRLSQISPTHSQRNSLTAIFWCDRKCGRFGSTQFSKCVCICASVMSFCICTIWDFKHQNQINQAKCWILLPFYIHSCLVLCQLLFQCFVLKMEPHPSFLGLLLQMFLRLILYFDWPVQS